MENEEKPSEVTEPKIEETSGVSAEITPPPAPKKNINKPYLYALIALLVAGLTGYFVYAQFIKEDPVSEDETTEEITAEEEVVDTEEVVVEEDSFGPIECLPPTSMFADSDFGMAFCYPTIWGLPTVSDVKVGADDTGYRESVFFADNTFFTVGGTSDDWTTTIGRGVGCLEPNNSLAELSSYDEEWHDIMGEGMAVEYATRSLPSSVGGYDMSETVSDYDGGVCVQGHKEINGSRYRVAFAAFYRAFAEASGITTPKAHMDNAEVLFSLEHRTQLDDLLASIIAY